MSPGEMRFELFSVGPPNHELYWNREANAFWHANDPSGRILWVRNCRTTDLRPILSRYERIAP